MKLESLGGKPLDYNVDQDVEKRGLYNDSQDEEELTSYDCLFDIEQYMIDNNNRAALDEARNQEEELRRLVAESEFKGFTANEIGKNTINTPTMDKKREESETHKMNPLEDEIFQAIDGMGDELDAKMQAEFLALTEQFENEL